MNRTRMGLLLGASLAVLGAMAQVEMAEMPAPSRGIKLGEVQCSLFADFMYFHDSNVDYVKENPTKDDGVQARVGVDLSYGGNEHTLFGRGWFLAERFLEESRVDRDQWGAELGHAYQSAGGTALRTDGVYEQVFQNDLETGRWHDRREFRLSVNAGRQFTEKTSAGVGVRMNDITYEQAGLYDWREYAADMDLGHQISARSDAILSVGAREQTSESVSDRSQGYTLSAGLSSRPTAKVSYRATAGVESYHSGLDDGSTMGVTYKLAMDWKAAEKWTVSLSGSGQHQPGEDVARNYAQVFTLGTGVTYRPTRRLSTTLRALYRRDDFAEPVRLGGTGPTFYIPINGPTRTWLIPVTLGQRWRGEDRVDDQVTVRGDVSLKLTKYATVSAGGEYSIRASTIESQYGYDRYRLQAGLNLRY